MGAEPRPWGNWQVGLTKVLDSFWLDLHPYIPSAACTEKNKTQTPRPKGKCFLHLPTRPSVVCPRVCPATHPSVLSSTLTKSGSPRTREKESRAQWRWEAHLSPGPSEKLEALGTGKKSQRGEDVSTGSSPPGGAALPGGAGLTSTSFRNPLSFCWIQVPCWLLGLWR